MDMRAIIKLMEAKDDDTAAKIGRSAFIYLEPKGDSEQFAQCGTCVMFMPGKKRCSIFGRNDKVVANASCGLYVHGEPHDDQDITDAVTPEQAGYVLGQVRCENCSWYREGRCELFAKLMQDLPDIFDLDIDVEPMACCNAWQG